MTAFPVEKVVIVPQVTPSSDGLMSASDKTKLDNISGGGGGVDLRDEGVLVRSGTSFLDFRGSGVTASSDGLVTITGTAAGVSSFNGRTGDVIPLQDDYDAVFLTQAEGDARYTQLTNVVSSFNGRTGSVSPQQGDYDGFFLTAVEGDTRYLTQEQANAQGMPAIESVAYSGGGSPSASISHGTGNITLRVPSTPADFWQSRRNTGTSAIITNPPSGYTISGSNSIDAGASGLFVKVAGASQFLRWS